MSIASGAAMRMPVPKSLLSTATAPGRADRGQRQAAPDRQRRDDRLVGELLALVLRSELVAGGVVEDLGDLGRVVVSLPDFSTATYTLPATMSVEAKTRSPTPFSAGVDSPVSAC